MAIANVGTSSGSFYWTSGNDGTITLPTYSAGDYCIIVAFTNKYNNIGSPSINESWLTVGINKTNATSGLRTKCAFYKILGASETNPEINMNLSSGGSVEWIAASYSGVDTTTPHDVSKTVASGVSQLLASAITPVTDNSMVLRTIGVLGTPAMGSPFCNASGFDDVIGNTGTDANVFLSEKLQTTAAAEGISSWDGTFDGHYSYSIALREGAGGGGGGGGGGDRRVFIQ